MRARGLEPDPDLIKFSEAFVESEGMRTFKELLNGPSEFTAVFAGNDLLALGCYDALAAEDLSCPSDVSIVGYNDIPFLDKLQPPLTTVRIPHYEIGRRAAELVLERLRDNSARPITVMLPPELVVRGSTAPLASR
jgi:LacI family transcriptional regulator